MRLGKYQHAEELLEEIATVETSIDMYRDDAERVFRSRSLLALAKARLGHFRSAEVDVEDTRTWFLGWLETPRTDAAKATEPIIRTATEDHWSAMLDFRSASINELSGRRAMALIESDRTSKILNSALGEFHPDSLESSALTALLMAHNSQITSAESLCSRTVKTLERSPGEEHPITMSGVRVSIEIDLRQALDIETTLIASDRLCKQYDAILRSEHLDTLESKPLFRRASVAAGNYRDVVNSLSRVVDVAEATFSNLNT
ncbi:hypothetical protein PG996_013933 [Apiospora saccharicola]|uniref:Tetratricopeptide repeat protein n=1 Tax=Apiospora saccharicola TaxID=335842 RepID=A0ABR1TGW5_9PEZI